MPRGGVEPPEKGLWPDPRSCKTKFSTIRTGDHLRFGRIAADCGLGDNRTGQKVRCADDTSAMPGSARQSPDQTLSFSSFSASRNNEGQSTPHRRLGF